MAGNRVPVEKGEQSGRTVTAPCSHNGVDPRVAKHGLKVGDPLRVGARQVSVSRVQRYTLADLISPGAQIGEGRLQTLGGKRTRRCDNAECAMGR